MYCYLQYIRLAHISTPTLPWLSVRCLPKYKPACTALHENMSAPTACVCLHFSEHISVGVSKEWLWVISHKVIKIERGRLLTRGGKGIYSGRVTETGSGMRKEKTFSIQESAQQLPWCLKHESHVLHLVEEAGKEERRERWGKTWYRVEVIGNKQVGEVNKRNAWGQTVKYSQAKQVWTAFFP